MKKVLNIKSAVKDKLPNPEALDFGQVAVNFNAESPFLAIRNSDDEISVFKSSDVIEVELDELDDKIDAVDAALDIESSARGSADLALQANIEALEDVVEENEEVVAEALNDLNINKQDALVAGTGIQITGNTINCTLDIYPFVVLQNYSQVEPYLAHYGAGGKIALVPNSSSSQDNIYDEYIWVLDPSIVPAGGRVEKLGEYQSTIDLTDYYTSAQTDSLLAQKQPIGNYVSASTLTNYYTSAQTDTVIDTAVADFYTMNQVDDMVDDLDGRLDDVESELTKNVSGATKPYLVVEISEADYEALSAKSNNTIYLISEA